MNAKPFEFLGDQLYVGPGLCLMSIVKGIGMIHFCTL
jgi:hypothetical protein